MTPPFQTGDEVTVVASPAVFARATVLDCKPDEEDANVWEVTVLIKCTGEVQTLKFKYTPQAQN